jgi:hypothetical protein
MKTPGADTEERYTWRGRGSVNVICRVDERNIRESSETTFFRFRLRKQLSATTVDSYAQWLNLFREFTVNSDEEDFLLLYSNSFFTAGLFQTVNTQLNTYFIVNIIYKQHTGMYLITFRFMFVYQSTTHNCLKHTVKCHRIHIVLVI